MLTVLPVLVISSQGDDGESLAARLSQCGLRSICCETIAAAKSLMARQQFSAVLSEDALPDGDFRAVIGEVGRQTNSVPVVIVSRRDDWDAYLAAVGAGAFDYVGFPPNPGELERAVWAALSESKRSGKALAESAA